MRKEYTIKELEVLLSCSRTAISKKITVDEATGIKRYRNRYEVVDKNGRMAIIFDDSELEEEIKLSKGTSNVTNVLSNVEENVIDVEPVAVENNQNIELKIAEISERYMNEFTTFQNNTQDIIKSIKDAYEGQTKLLTVNENSFKQKYFEEVAETKKLKASNSILKIVLAIVATLFICLMMFVTFNKTFDDNVSNVVPEQNLK